MANQTAKQKAAAKAKAEKEKAAKARKDAQEKRQAEKAAERQGLIDSGALIEDGEAEFHRVESKTKNVLDERAKQVLEVLERSKTPVVGKELQERFGGVWPLYIPMFSMLKAQGLIVEYRRRTGSRGGSGVAYLHQNHVA